MLRRSRQWSRRTVFLPWWCSQYSDIPGLAQNTIMDGSCPQNLLWSSCMATAMGNEVIFAQTSKKVGNVFSLWNLFGDIWKYIPLVESFVFVFHWHQYVSVANCSFKTFFLKKPRFRCYRFELFWYLT